MGYTYDLAGAWVTAGAGSPRHRTEGTKAPKLDALSPQDGLDDACDEGVGGSCSFGTRESGARGDLAGEVGFGHRGISSRLCVGPKT